MSIAITLGVIFVYLILIFGVSAVSQRRLKKAEAEGITGSFLIADKNLPTALVAFMMAGAGIGAINTTGIAEQVQTAGLSGATAGFAGAIALIVLALFGAKRMRALPYNSMPSMAKAYCGETTRWLLSIGGLMIAAAITALQFKGGGAMLASMFPDYISPEMGMTITAIVFFVITVLGGMSGCSVVNLINVIVMYLGLGLLLIAALKNIGGWNELINQVNAIPEPTTSGAPWLSITGGLGLATVVSYFASEIPNRYTTQSNTQQIFAAKSGKTARDGLIIGALLMVPITIISTIIGLIARVQFPDLAFKTQAMSMVVMSVNPFLSGMGMAAIWAVNISTGVALMMTCTQLIYYDVIQVFAPKREVTEKSQAFQSRIILVFVTIGTLIMAFYMGGIVSTIMTMICITPAFAFIFVPILYAPKLLKKSTGPVLLAGSYIFFLLWMVIPPLKAMFPNPVYPEWGLAIILFILCYVLDKRPIDIPEGDREAIKNR
jgi:SSS family solute:Na+ symporter